MNKHEAIFVLLMSMLVMALLTYAAAYPADAALDANGNRIVVYEA